MSDTAYAGGFLGYENCLSMLHFLKQEHINKVMVKSENNIISINKKKDGAMGFAWFVAFIGAAVYFVNQVDGFWNILAAICKALIWPGILVYNILQSFTA